MQGREGKIIYATLGRRIYASIIDSVILLSLILLIPFGIGQVIREPFGALGGLMYAPVFILEPLLVSYWGQTVGQYLWGIKVVRETDLTKCPLVLSFVRYYAKALLGLWSMIYMLFSRKHKAIHDYLAHTVVILSPYRLAKTPWFAESGIMEQKPEKGFVFPSALRRFVFFVIWWFLAFVVLYAIVDALLSLALGTDRAARLLKSGDQLVTFLGLILLLVVASLSAKGLLPGARRKPQTFTESVAVSTDNEDRDRTKTSS